VIIALVVTPEGLPLAYDVLPGNTKDDTTRFSRPHRAAIRQGAADLADRSRRADRGAVLAEMRAADPPVQYLVGTPKGR
jgi:hypothetical protein